MKLVNYLVFDGNCSEAFQHYESVLGGKIITRITHGDSPMAAHTPPDQLQRIMHVRLDVGDQTLMGSDNPVGVEQQMEGFCVSINLEDVAAAERIYASLSDGGSFRWPWSQPSGQSASRCSATASEPPG
jgi:PhnB protein